MSTPIVNQIPTFASLQQTAPQSPMNAPSGGANGIPAPVSQPGGIASPAPQAPPVQPAPAPQAPQSYIAQLEAQGRVPVGRFKSEAELIESLYSVAENSVNELEALRSRPAEPVVTTPPAPQPAPVEDLTAMAVPFQQHGWLSLTNGQWVANNPAATSLAQQLNQRAAEAQARQAELADPASFIRKYGKDVFEEAVKPLKSEIEQLREYNQRLQQEIAKAVPKPHETWVKQNESALWTTDPAGQRKPSAAGQAYSDAWDLGAKYNMAPEDLHQMAMNAAKPYMTQTAPQPQAQPPQSWMQQVAANPPAPNPAFNAPGTVLNNNVPPQHRDPILGADGFPSYSRMQALPQ
jgi:hypothetical protein